MHAHAPDDQNIRYNDTNTRTFVRRMPLICTQRAPLPLPTNIEQRLMWAARERGGLFEPPPFSAVLVLQRRRVFGMKFVLSKRQ